MLMAFKLRATVSPELPRAPSLELCVLPNSGGQNFVGENCACTLSQRGAVFVPLVPFAAMELTGIEPVTSAVRLQRSPS
jgi:hypothetical protein